MYTEDAALNRVCSLRSPEYFQPTQVRYIKLGAGGGWTAQAFDQGIIPVDFHEVPHEPCVSGEWDQVKRHLKDIGTPASTATSWTRELRDFYEQDERCLWITFANGHLYWALAEPGVIATPNDSGHPQRHRRTVDGWHRDALDGTPLTTRSLSSALLKTAGYQMTICAVEHEAYLLRRLRNEEDPLYSEATALQARMVELAGAMIQQLDWRDFEMLVDLIFARGGWQRSSAVGKGEVDLDLLFTMPTTGETAWVQVKSKATQATVTDYLARFDQDGSCDHFFFVCHTAPRSLSVPPRKGLHLWTGLTMAKAALGAGLFEWLMDRTR
jgi:hypothetical protein